MYLQLFKFMRYCCKIILFKISHQKCLLSLSSVTNTNTCSLRRTLNTKKYTFFCQTYHFTSYRSWNLIYKLQYLTNVKCVCVRRTPIPQIKIGPTSKPAWLTAKGIVSEPAPNMIRRRLKYAIQGLQVDNRAYMGLR